MSRLTPPLGVVVFVVGSASLGSEIAAARLLAPYFGDSTIIWANTIGVVLVALSVGYWIGGRMADRDATPAGLYRLVLIAAVLLAIVPFLAHPFLGLAVDALDTVAAGAFVGSLVGVLVLVATPVLVLGMVSPFAIRLALEQIDDAGKTTGRLYAISTLGSLRGRSSARSCSSRSSGRGGRSWPSRSRSPSSGSWGSRGRGGRSCPPPSRGAAAAGRDREGGRATRAAWSTTPTPSTSTRGSSSRRAASGASSSTRGRRSTRSSAPAPISPGATGTT